MTSLSLDDCSRRDLSQSDLVNLYYLSPPISSSDLIYLYLMPYLVNIAFLSFHTSLVSRKHCISLFSRTPLSLCLLQADPTSIARDFFGTISSRLRTRVRPPSPLLRSLSRTYHVHKHPGHQSHLFPFSFFILLFLPVVLLFVIFILCGSYHWLCHSYLYQPQTGALSKYWALCVSRYLLHV